MENKKLILIIDDDPDILNNTRVILESNGFATAIAKSGKEGIDTAISRKPDLILCDMMMEHIDSGTKVAQEIRKMNSSVPIYLMSSIGEATASNIEVDKLGFNGMFQKPVYPDSIVKLLKKALGI